MKKGILLITSLLLVFMTFGQTTIYVSKDGNNTDGSSWVNAYTDLQTAINNAVSGDEILVAKGVYTPHANDRAVSFEMKPGVKVYGGFAGTESPVTNEVFRNRDFETNETVLSGDLNQDDATGGDNTENSYTVVHYNAGIAEIDQQTMLDGFTVSGGNSDDEADWSEKKYGGGLFFEPASSKDCAPVLRNLIIRDNEAINGAGVYVYTIGNVNASTSPEFYNVVFIDNYASDTYGTGGAVYVRSSENNPTSPKFVNCLFNNNTAMSSGGAVYVVANGLNSNTTATFINCTFVNNKGTYVENSQVYNTAQNEGNCTVYYKNCVIWGPSGTNHFSNFINTNGTLNATISNSLVKGSGGSASWNSDFGTDGGGNVDANPLFENLYGEDESPGTIDDSFDVLAHSPALDAGSETHLPLDEYDIDFDGNTTEPLPIDLEGSARIADNNSGNPTVNMGAHETGGAAYVNPWPQPSNWVTAFSASDIDNTTIEVSWTASTGEILPHKYLILAKRGIGYVPTPYIEDGSYFTNKPFTEEDNYAIVILDHVDGSMSYTFENLETDKHYSFEIFPFTNEMEDTKYKNGYVNHVWLGNVKQEPTHHVTNFDTVNVTVESVVLEWTGSVGDVLPDGYVIAGKMNGGYFDEYLIDGEYWTDDLNWTDDNTVLVKVTHVNGQNQYTFNGLEADTHYDFAIFPYTNSDEDIDYKSFGVEEVPEVSFRTKYYGPVLTKQPENKILLVGDEMTLTVGATGGNLSYQWMKDEMAIDGAVDSSYTISNVSLSDVGLYHCTVSNDHGTRNSTEARLQIFEGEIPGFTMTRNTHAPNHNDTVLLNIFDYYPDSNWEGYGNEPHWDFSNVYFEGSSTELDIYRDTSNVNGYPGTNMYVKSMEEDYLDTTFLHIADTGYYWLIETNPDEKEIFYLKKLAYPFGPGNSFESNIVDTITMDEEQVPVEAHIKVTIDAIGKITLPYLDDSYTFSDVLRVKTELTQKMMGEENTSTTYSWYIEEYNHFICYYDEDYNKIYVDESFLEKVNTEEPTNHASNLIATDSTDTSITISWDYSGEIEPDAYLIRAFRYEGGPISVEAIEDGKSYEDNLSWEYVTAIVNVDHQDGMNSFTFDNLIPGYKYGFSVYPYTKNEFFINYKTDGDNAYISSFTVGDPPVIEMTIAKQPLSKTVQVGENTSLSVEVSEAGSSVSYQWFNDSGVMVDDTVASIEIENVQLSNEGYYYCIITSASDTLKSASAFITVVEQLPVTFALSKETHLPADGDGFIQQSNSFTNNANFSETGYNVIWDLSDVTYEEEIWETSEYQFHDTTGVSQAADVNLYVKDITDNSLELFYACDTGFYSRGNIYNEEFSEIAPGMPYLLYPTVYDTKIKSFQGQHITAFSNFDYDYDRNSNGYGTLIFKKPDGNVASIPNTIRTHEVIKINIDGSDMISNRYRWFVEDYKFPVVEIFTSEDDNYIDISIDQNYVTAGPKQEPDNHVTNLKAEHTGIGKVKLEWTGSEGTVLPDFYLIIAVEQTSGALPTVQDGLYHANKILTDGVCIANVVHTDGTNSHVVSGLEEGKSYTFYIYPYSNIYEIVDYKSDVDVPSVSHQLVTVGIDPMLVSDRFTIYPNPADDRLTIESTVEDVWSYDIYDIQGRKVLGQNNIFADLLTFDIQDLKQGYYIIQIQTTQGTFNQKLMIK